MRAACAGCLALYISFSLNLDGSHWALTTCFIVGSERQSGRILAKSAARIVGTLVGVMASFTLVNAFAQERVLFICCFAAWLSICAYFSHYQRGHWAYAWVLSGYTTAIVGVPAASASQWRGLEVAAIPQVAADRSRAIPFNQSVVNKNHQLVLTA